MKPIFLIVILKFMQELWTESQDWAEMLRRMYLKWSDNKKFKSNLISEHKGMKLELNHQQLRLKETMFLDG